VSLQAKRRMGITSLGFWLILTLFDWKKGREIQKWRQFVKKREKILDEDGSFLDGSTIY
jgi:hypothetical protein